MSELGLRPRLRRRALLQDAENRVGEDLAAGYTGVFLPRQLERMTIQRLLGHTDVRTTMIYLQTVPSVTLREAKSPLDLGTSGVRS